MGTWAGEQAEIRIWAPNKARCCHWGWRWVCKARSRQVFWLTSASGLIAYRELSEAGFDVHIYERDNAPGGNWHYTEETPVDTPMPSSSEVSKGDYEPWLPPKGHSSGYSQIFSGEEANTVRRSHRAPKPVWKSLTSNAPAPVQQIREWPWPSGTSWCM